MVSMTFLTVVSSRDLQSRMAAIFARCCYVYVFTFCLLAAYKFVTFVECDGRLTGISPVDSSGAIKDGAVEIKAETSTFFSVHANYVRMLFPFQISYH